MQNEKAIDFYRLTLTYLAIELDIVPQIYIVCH
jgi:hypothetical protein